MVRCGKAWGVVRHGVWAVGVVGVVRRGVGYGVVRCGGYGVEVCM